MRTIRRGLSRLFPHTARRYKRFRNAAYLRCFEMFPTLASALREYGQGAHKKHRSSFGIDLVGPTELIDCGYESEELELVRQKLQEVEVFVDVGANIGLYTCLAASEGRRVVAVEPLASNLRYLYQNLMGNKLNQVEVFPIGLASTPSLSVLAGMGAQASFLADWAKEDYGHNRYIGTVCPSSTLDIVLGTRFSGKRLLIKMDVEGFEFQVLQGASATLSMSPKPIWIIECFLERFHPGGNNANFLATFNMFFDRGYRAHVAEVNGAEVTRNTVEHWVKQGAVDGMVSNFIFTPDVP
jgi:FkbM family methyltransferase